MHNHPFAFAMRRALTLAEQGRWHAAPNPTVGAVLVREGSIVAEGWHTAYGQPHAEIECLRDAASKGINPAECTLVVTLEPCNHHGKTPPCSHAVVNAGIKHVVIGLTDSNPIAQGGAVYLQEHGVTVEMGIEQDACQLLISDFLTWKQQHRPYVMLKMASTLDGKIATRTGHSQWISGADARAHVHDLRAAMAASGNNNQCGGAVLIGGQTLRDDDPQLTARLEDNNCTQPLAVIVTQHLPSIHALPRILQERPEQCIFFTTKSAAQSEQAKQLQALGTVIMGLPEHSACAFFSQKSEKEGLLSFGTSPRLDLRVGLERLFTEHGIFYVLCEGGGKLALSLLEEKLIDIFELHLAPKILGDASARSLFDGRMPLSMSEALHLQIVATKACGEDCIITLRPCI